VGPYHPVVGWPTTAPTADLTSLAPGVRHLIEDYRSAALSPYEFVQLALTKMGYRPGIVPARYADDPSRLTQPDLAALAFASREAGNHLTADQMAALKTEATLQP